MLREAFPRDTVIAPNFPIDPDAVYDILRDIVENAKSFPLVFVGTSLGGFWANVASQRWDAPCVLVNPSPSPSRFLENQVGQDLKNYVTGKPFTVTRTDAAKFKSIEESAKVQPNGALVTLFVAEDDEKIPYNKMLLQYPYTRCTTVKKDGGHRFLQHWPEVLSTIAAVIDEGIPKIKVDPKDILEDVD